MALDDGLGMRVQVHSFSEELREGKTLGKGRREETKRPRRADGLDSSNCYPKVWKGAEDVFNLAKAKGGGRGEESATKMRVWLRGRARLVHLKGSISTAYQSEMGQSKASFGRIKVNLCRKFFSLQHEKG